MKGNIKKEVISRIKYRLVKKEYNVYMRWLNGYMSNQDKLDSVRRSEIVSYWNKLGFSVSGDWHKFYISRSGIDDNNFIDDAMFYSRLFPLLNRQELSKAYADKNYYDDLFKGIPRPKTVVRNINGYFYTDEGTLIEEQKAVDRCFNYEKIIIKPAMDSCGGRGIEIIETSDRQALSRIRKSMLEHSRDYIIQDVISQCEEVMKLNKTTLNTIRITSFFLRANRYYVARFSVLELKTLIMLEWNRIVSIMALQKMGDLTEEIMILRIIGFLILSPVVINLESLSIPMYWNLFVKSIEDAHLIYNSLGAMSHLISMEMLFYWK